MTTVRRFEGNDAATNRVKERTANKRFARAASEDEDDLEEETPEEWLFRQQQEALKELSDDIVREQEDVLWYPGEEDWDEKWLEDDEDR